MLSRGRRGLMVTYGDDQFWVVESEHPVEHLVGSEVIVEGTAIGIDRLRADWIGTAPANSTT